MEVFYETAANPWIVSCTPIPFVTCRMQSNVDIQFHPGKRNGASCSTEPGRRRACRLPSLNGTQLSNCCSKRCRGVRLGALIFHPGFDTLSPICKSWTSSGTMGSGRPELLGLLKGGSLFIWGHYNSTKACGCLHTQRMRMNGLFLH